MPTLSLQNVYYTQLEPMTWCATASIASPVLPNLRSGSYFAVIPYSTFSHPINLHSLHWQIYNDNRPLSAREVALRRRQQQRKGVRLLLQNLLIKLAIVDTLDETQFPYRLVNSRYYVCFSHSGDTVAVAISHHRAIGIDVETQGIAWHVAQRFYHPAEITMLAALPIEKRLVMSKWLWQLKESFIKIYQYKLAQGLGMSYLPIMSALVDSMAPHKVSASPLIVNDSEDGYQIAILPQQQTIVIF